MLAGSSSEINIEAKSGRSRRSPECLQTSAEYKQYILVRSAIGHSSHLKDLANIRPPREKLVYHLRTHIVQRRRNLAGLL